MGQSLASNRANRGLALEHLIELACQQYRTRRMALIHKVPTAWLPIRDGRGRVVSAKVDQKAAVDFLGIDRCGRPLAFDAKEAGDGRWPLNHLPPHQEEFLRLWHWLGGVAFVLVQFRGLECYVLPWPELEDRLRTWRERGRPASITRQELDASRPAILPGKGGIALDWLPEIDRVWGVSVSYAEGAKSDGGTTG